MRLLSRLLTALAAGLIALAVLSVLLSNADPAVRAERLRREQIKTQAAAERAEAMTALAQGVVVIVLAGLGGAVIVGLALGGVLVLHRVRLAREIHVDPATALYPIIREAAGVYSVLNAPGSQQIAALSMGRRRPTAAMVGRVLDSPALPTAPQTPALGAAPAEHYPARVDVYNAPMPKRLALPVGVAGDGRHVALPLRGLGNVVVGGLPNYGKSELLASMAAGLLRQDATGESQQIAVVDMKLVSFGNLPALAALRWPVATEIDDAHQVIAAARAECSRRYEVLRSARARTLEEYQDFTGEPLPYLTVMIDEIADLTQDDDRGRRERFLASAMEIARKGRAAGVGLVMATQRPSADVLPSSLRNLAGAQIAFKVQRNHDSIAVLGEPGAEALPAVPGRCLVRHSSTVQVQAFYAGLEGGRFDAFVAQLPMGEADALPAPTWPVRGTDAVYRADPAPVSGIPVWSTDDRAAYTAEQIAHIRVRYADLGSIKAVERELYAQDGGYWFYRLKEVLQ